MMSKPENKTKPELMTAEEEADFAAFEDSAKSSAEFFKAGTMYLVVLVKPEEFEAPSVFTDKSGKAKMQKNYKISVLDLDSGSIVKIPTYAKMYLDMLAKFEAFKAKGIAPLLYQGHKVYPWVRAVSGKSF